ncbi:hypothetical protein LEP1GSC021_1241 [Leptospira noguchii str. 1993005606]|nr:hypothetical protein LEP1GSC021_1241 [Leptospira noguchii str. 1993005606]
MGTLTKLRNCRYNTQMWELPQITILRTNSKNVGTYTFRNQ